MQPANTVENKTGGQPIAWPWYVRWLAVAHILSRFVGPLGFFVLACVAGNRFARNGQVFDVGVVATIAAAWSFPAGCAAFRWWFCRWGRRRWPET